MKGEMKMPQVKWSDLDPAEQAVLISTLDNALGFTVERASDLVAKSRAEGVEKSLEDDATGDLKHFLRHDRHWGGAVDAAWPFLEPFARVVVQAAIKAGA